MLLLLCSLALADIPPPPTYVELCTPEIQCGALESMTCKSVMGEVVTDDPRKPLCMDNIVEWKPIPPWTERCSTWGGTVRQVVYCKGEPDAAGVASRERMAKVPMWGCIASPPLVVFGLGILGVVAWRRRKAAA